MKRQQHLAAYKKAIQEKSKVPIRVVKFNNIGLPRSGKTSFHRRIMGMILNLMEAEKRGEKEQPSTGVAEAGGQVFISSKTILNMGTISSKGWSVIKTLNEETGMLNKLVECNESTSDYQPVERASESAPRAGPTQREPSKVKRIARSLWKHLSSLGTRASQDEAFCLIEEETDESFCFIEEEIDKAFCFIEEATDAGNWDDIADLLDELILLINTDTGGQAEFLDLQASLVQGPSFNLLFSRLVDKLDSLFEVYYTNEDSKSTEKTHSTMTAEEVLFQCLACVASYSGTFHDGDSMPSEKASGSDSAAKDSESKVMFVGTFRDQVSNEEFEEKDRLLRMKIESTPFYERGIVEFASEDQLMLAVNNMSGDQAEIDEIRRILVKVIKKSFKKIDIPTSWLVLSLQIRRRKLRTMSLEACEALAKEVRIDPKELQDALWFLHHHVGVLLYYPDIPALESTVICDVQVVYDSASNLIKNTFTFERVNQMESKKFQDTAQFSLKNVEEATSQYTDDSIPLKKLVKLLQYLGILTVVPSTSTSSSVENAEEPTYFMPCVLKSARASELKIPCLDPAPLLVCYDCGYVPVGVFPSLITHLVSQQQRLGWKIIEKGIFKNKVDFHVGSNYDTITLISRPRYLEIVVRRSDTLLCLNVRKVIQSILRTATFNTNYHFSMPYKFGFECPLHPGREHLCIYEKESAKKMLCLKDLKMKRPVDLESRHTVWFGLPTSGGKLVPDLEFLTLFKWKDAQGVEQELRIVSTVSAKWRELGFLVGLISPELDGFDRRSLHNNFECCVHVFSHWCSNDGHPPKYPLNWKGLYDLLCDAKHKTVAKDLEEALASRGVSIHA
jgi:hypothetical protein